MTLVLVRDLMFTSRIRAAAQSLGAAIQFLRDPDQLAAAEGTLLIVDLNQAGFLNAAAGWKCRTAGRVVGFVSHVDVETIQAGKDAGFEVLPHSRFVERLAELLR
jgi:hypothetical protein